MDIQAQGKSKGYAQWAKIFNLKQMAQSVNFLQEHKLLAYSDLEEKAKKCTATFDELNTQIKTAEKITNRKRELTEEETKAVNENCNKLLALCEL